jgi:hypothetical protein
MPSMPPFSSWHLSVYHRAGLGGGGIYASGSGTTVELTDVEIAGNDGGTDANGIYFSSLTATVKNSVIIDNSVRPTLY